MLKILIFVLILLPIPLNAQVIINEVAWMGTEVPGNDEWIELKNTSSQNIDLTNWKLKAIDSSPEITLQGSILANGFFLLERTDDNSAPTVTADQIYAGSLSNSGEHLQLFDTDNNLIDEINNSENWSGGDNSTKTTLQRINDLWQTSLEPGGSPKAQNQQNNQLPETDEDTKDNSENETTTQTGAGSPTQKIEKQDIVINEIFPNPKGLDNSEFIELKNISNKRINLEGLKLKTIVDQFASSTETLKINVVKTLNLATPTPTSTTEIIDQGLEEKDLENFETLPFIFISEFLPNPEGSDLEDEFIELFNQENYAVDITGWQLKDSSKNKAYTFPTKTIIKPNQYLAVFRPETKIALNNSSDSIELINQKQNTLDYVEYEDSIEAQSFILNQDFIWQQTSTPTPGEINVLDTQEPVEENKKAEAKVLGASTSTSSVTSSVTLEEFAPDKSKRFFIATIITLCVIIFYLLYKLINRTK